MIFLFPLLGTLLPIRGDSHVRALGLALFAIIAALMIGLRFEVGGDWGTYLLYTEMIEAMSFRESIELNDVGYMAINWVSVQLGFGIAGVNLVCGSLMAYGILRFCRQQPLPWLGLLITTPYLLIVVGMGYSRQGVALGIIFWALSNWKKNNFFKYTSLVLLAALFHKSAIVMFIFGVFIKTRYHQAKRLLILIVLFLGYWYGSGYITTGQFRAYFIVGYDSSGGMVRVLMNVAPSLLIVLFYKKFSQFEDFRLWLMMAAASFFTLVSVFWLSAATDRFALYLAPIQVAVLTRIPVMIADPFLRTLVVFLIILMYSLVLFVWLNFGVHAYSWLPYKTIFEIGNHIEVLGE